MTRAAATTLWLVIGACSALGCIPIITPRVQQDITTGDKLLAIKMAEGTAPPDQLAALRADLLVHPPDMRASIEAGYRAYGDPPPPPSSYSPFDPGFYASVLTERADLKRARDAGILSDAEFAELDAELDRQAERSMVRRWFETAPVAISGSIVRGYFASSSCIERTPAASRAWSTRSWLPEALESGDANRNEGQYRFLGVPREYLRGFLMDPAKAKSATAP